MHPSDTGETMHLCKPTARQMKTDRMNGKNERQQGWTQWSDIRQHIVSSMFILSNKYSIIFLRMLSSQMSNWFNWLKLNSNCRADVRWERERSSLKLNTHTRMHACTQARTHTHTQTHTNTHQFWVTSVLYQIIITHARLFCPKASKFRSQT